MPLTLICFTVNVEVAVCQTYLVGFYWESEALTSQLQTSKQQEEQMCPGTTLAPRPRAPLLPVGHACGSATARRVRGAFRHRVSVASCITPEAATLGPLCPLPHRAVGSRSAFRAGLRPPRAATPFQCFYPPGE